MLESTSSLIHSEYTSRINKVQDYIEANLGGDISLDILADISGFSKFHFCRIFRGIIKETLLSYINRIRLERATGYLLHNPSMSITEIAMQLGFSDSAVFARAFKKHYGMSASEVRKKYSKNCKVDSKDCKANMILPRYNEKVSNTLRKNNDILVKGNVEVRIIEEIKAIYLRHMGSYEELATVFQGMLGKLISWAMARNLIGCDGIKLFSIYHDNPEFTEDENLKTSICLAVSEDIKVEGEIGKINIPSGKYAIGHFEIDRSDITNAWDYIYGEWLPKSGFQPDKGYIFEMYANDPNTHPEKKQILDIYLPVKPL
ncbi:GyrI-like domain-containing protein [Wukongibacter baidiensis]|uniref:AraC family transcriptional regulator n=1 Tax=Wukongibacter baidiensis TaxID=1723361 RepID=UPI003D7F972A